MIDPRTGTSSMPLGVEVFFFDGQKIIPGIVVETGEKYCVVGLFTPYTYVTDTITEPNFCNTRFSQYGHWCFR